MDSKDVEALVERLRDLSEAVVCGWTIQTPDDKSELSCLMEEAAVALEALSASRSEIDRGKLERAAYMQGWRDREDDFIAGVQQIVPLSVETAMDEPPISTDLSGEKLPPTNGRTTR